MLINNPIQQPHSDTANICEGTDGDQSLEAGMLDHRMKDYVCPGSGLVRDGTINRLNLRFCTIRTRLKIGTHLNAEMCF